MNPSEPLSRRLRIDAEQEVEKICGLLRRLAARIRRRGMVVGVSGGIDSSVTAALAARAIGPERVLALEMPERHSAEETVRLSSLAADSIGIRKIREDITGILEALGCYARYHDAVRSVIPEYGDGWKSKIISGSLQERNGFRLFSLVAMGPDGTVIKKQLPAKPFLEIVAASNFKQRTRKMLEYYHADRLNYAVLGTPNRLEYDQGFFVKLGDGASDIKPIAHLYKTQVYQLAEYLEIPAEIRERPPTTDTYSLSQGQDEFYFSLPYQQMDLCLYGKNNAIPPEALASELGLSADTVRTVYDDIETKRSTTRYLHMPPLLVERVTEIDGHLETGYGSAGMAFG